MKTELYNEWIKIALKAKDFTLVGKLIFDRNYEEYWKKFGRRMHECSMLDPECHERILKEQREYYANKS